MIISRVVIVLLLFLGSLSVCCTHKEPDVLEVVKKVCDTYRGLETFSGTTDVVLGSMEPGSSIITARLKGDLRMKKNEQDSLVGWKLVSEITNLDNPISGYKIFYSGGSVLQYNKIDSTTEFSPAEAVSTDWGHNLFKEGKDMFRLYAARLTLPDSAFQKLEGAKGIGEITLGRDTVIENRKCWLVENYLYLDDTVKHTRTVKRTRVAVDQEKSFPVYFYSYLDYQSSGFSIEQETWKAFFDVHLNGQVEDAIFEYKGRLKEKENVKAPVLLPVGTKVPDWEFTSAQGENIRLYAQQADVFILEFGYLGCGWCTQVNREIKEKILSRPEYKDAVRMYYLDPIDSEEQLKEYVEKTDVIYPVFKTDKAFARSYGVGTSFPQVYVLDRNFVVKKTFKGFRENMGEEIEKIIKEAQKVSKKK